MSTPMTCTHGRTSRTTLDDGTAHCECGALIATDGATVIEAQHPMFDRRVWWFNGADRHAGGHVIGFADRFVAVVRLPNGRTTKVRVGDLRT